MRRILFVMGTMGMGGAEKSLVSLFNMLTPDIMEKHGLSIDFMVPDIKGELMSEVPEHIHIVHAPYAFCCYALPCKSAKKVLKSRVLVPVMKAFYRLNCSRLWHDELSENENYWNANSRFIPCLRKEYDLCIAYMNGTATYFAIEKVRAHRKVVWVHNEYGELRYNDSFQRKFYERTDLIVTISNKCVESFAKHFPELKNKVRMIENISSNSVIHDKADAFFPIEYCSTRTRIVSIGRLTKQKGFDIGIECMLILKNQDFDFDWYIIGEGEEREALQKKISDLGLMDYIHLIGIRKNPYPYIKNADIFFQPSRYEGKSITLDEAKILEKPIVVSNYSTVYDSITSGVNGTICDLSPDGLEYGLQEMISNSDLRNRYIDMLRRAEKGNEYEIKKYVALMLGE